MSLILKHIRNDVHVLSNIFIVAYIWTRVNELIYLNRHYVEDGIVNVFSHQVKIRCYHVQKLIVVSIATTQRHRIVKTAESKRLVSNQLKIRRILESTIDTSIARVTTAIILLGKFIEDTLTTKAASGLCAFIRSDFSIESLSIDCLNLSKVFCNL